MKNIQKRLSLLSSVILLTESETSAKCFSQIIFDMNPHCSKHKRGMSPQAQHFFYDHYHQESMIGGGGFINTV